MRTVLSFVAAAGLLTFSACDSKKIEETTNAQDVTTATDIAETTAAPIDTIGLSKDSAATDSVR